MGFEVQAQHAGQPTAAAAAHVADEHPVRETSLWDGANVDGAASVGAVGLGANTNQGPHLKGFWNRLFGAPSEIPADGLTNHIGQHTGRTHHQPGFLSEGGTLSNMMRSTPYLGDYWEALSAAHDAAHYNGMMNSVTAFSNVGVSGPLMGLVDAPFRAFGKSLFLDK